MGTSTAGAAPAVRQGEPAAAIRATIAIVGAGPAGTATALHLARLGVRDVVLLDAQDFPRHKTCGSGISPRGMEVLKDLGVYDRVRPMAYPIMGLRLVTPRGHDLMLSAGDEAQALICLRKDLDYEMLKGALDLGVRFVPYFRAAEPIVERGRWAGVRGQNGRTVRADYVIVANGAHSKFTLDTSPKRTIHTIMGWWNGVSFPKNHIEMIFDPMIAPYYGWLFPETETRVNIGITYEDDTLKLNARKLFREFLDKHYGPRLAGAEQLGAWKGHPIVYTYGITSLSSPGRVIVGEAGRMTHSATGEGIYQGMRSGMYAAEALRDVVQRGVSEESAFRAYERRCRKTFLASFWAGRAFRRAVRTPLLDWVADVGTQPMVKKLGATLLASL